MVDTNNLNESTREEKKVTIDLSTTVSSMATSGSESTIDPSGTEVVFDVEQLDAFYGDFKALSNVSLQVCKSQVTAFIGPSGCGKSTFLRCFNRMNDLIEGARVEGTIKYHGADLYHDEVDPVEVRRRCLLYTSDAADE